ncbi:MAG: hypothetical protein JWP36_36 [Paucimonas sp.]|nr:hypothetical protein [Paucimonas sp.]
MIRDWLPGLLSRAAFAAVRQAGNHCAIDLSTACAKAMWLPSGSVIIKVFNLSPTRLAACRCPVIDDMRPLLVHGTLSARQPLFPASRAQSRQGNTAHNRSAPDIPARIATSAVALRPPIHAKKICFDGEAPCKAGMPFTNQKSFNDFPYTGGYGSCSQELGNRKAHGRSRLACRRTAQPFPNLHPEGVVHEKISKPAV